MKYCWGIYIVLMSLFQATALVHYVKLQKGVLGCKSPLTQKDVKVGQFERYPNVCGVLACESMEGDGAILMCPKVFPFVHCESEVVSGSVDFPQCCYTCGKPVDC